jgi:hypothetical protein
MSWTLKVQRKDQSQLSKFTIAEDDIIFYAVLKRAQIEHFKTNGNGNYKTRVRVLHLGDTEIGNIVFYMTLLESSTIENFYPQFQTSGLMGRWKLITPISANAHNNKEIEPFVSLVQAFDEKSLALTEEFLRCAQSKKNPEFIRKSYIQLS